MHKRFCVVGTDARQRAAAQALREQGFSVVGEDGAGSADYILLPMPMDADQTAMTRVLCSTAPGTLVLGGRISAPTEVAAKAAGVELVDYFLRPELAVLNAVPTAEGAIGLLLELRDTTLWQSRVLVVGYGRIGQALARRLAALGAQVTVAARSVRQRALAQCDGCRACELTALAVEAAQADAIVNTVPALVLTAEVLDEISPGTLILDLASRPGGTDFAAAQERGIQAIHALSLPAKCAPRTAGRLVVQTVLTILRERGEIR